MTPSTESYRLIPLTKGYFTKVSAHRFEELSRYSWHAHKANGGIYAYRGERFGRRVVKTPMHRQILGMLKGGDKIPDHINGDTLDNRDENLRVANRYQNGANRKAPKNSSTGYRGVSFHKRIGKYQSVVYHQKIMVFCGYFDDPSEAFEVREAVAKKLHAEFHSKR